ncbi:hypothetical protein [Bacillus velezensis]|uniref:hypothetical protein n=1 Tax=Bacillus velezensis TaxID=492670 RepID=UPI002E1F78B9|nr:hypothetical protein [Bacillus velezensis]
MLVTIKKLPLAKIDGTSGNRLILDVCFDGLRIKSFIRIHNGDWRVAFDKLDSTKKEVEDYNAKLIEAQFL